MKSKYSQFWKTVLLIIALPQINASLQTLAEDEAKIDFSPILHKLKEIEDKLNAVRNFAKAGTTLGAGDGSNTQDIQSVKDEILEQYSNLSSTIQQIVVNQDNLEKRIKKQGLRLFLYILAVKPNFDPLLISTTAYGKTDVLLALLDLGVSVEYQDEEHNRPIHIAVYYSKIENLRTLLDRGGDPNSHGKNSYTPLHVASFGCVECAKILLEKGAIVDSRDDWEDTPLIKAAKYGKDEIVKVLLEKGANVNAVQNYRYSSLHMAAREGHAKTVDMLVKHGADLFLRTSDNNHTAIDFASENNHHEIVSYLRSEMNKKRNN